MCNAQSTFCNVCRTNTFQFFQHLLCRQQASHQTPPVYPPLQMTAKNGWIKHLLHWSTSTSYFLSLLRSSGQFGIGGRTLWSLVYWAGTVYAVLWFDRTACALTALGFFETLGWALKVEWWWGLDLFCSFVSAYVKGILIGWIKSKAVIGHEEN